MINVNEAKKILMDLIKIRSVTSDPEDNYRNKGDYISFVKYVEEYCRKHNLEYRVINVGGESKEYYKPHIVVKVGRRGRRILLLTHMDVVPASEREWRVTKPFEPKEVKGKIYGRGAADNKGAVATALAIFKELKKVEDKLENTLILLIACDEECGGPYGIEAIADRVVDEEKVEICWVLDSSIEFLSPGCCAAIILKVEVKGKGGHSAYPYRTLNPIYPMAKIIVDIEKYAREIEEKMLSRFLAPEHYILLPVRISPTILKVDSTRPNVIPSRAELTLNIRVPPDINPQEALKSICEHIASISKNRRSWEGYEVNIEVRSILDGYYTDITQNKLARKLVETLITSMEKSTGKRIPIAMEPATNDGRFFAHKIPVVNLGVIEAESNIHGPDENISISSLKDIMQCIRDVALTKL